MATIARTAKAGGGTNFNDGQTIDPDEVNTDFNTVYTEINGALDDGNIETATIPGAKSLRFTEISAPSSPSSNDIVVYAVDDGGTTRINTKDAAGAVKEVVGFDTSGNLGVGTDTFGTSAANVLTIKSSTAPTTAVADSVSIWQADISGAGTSGPRMMVESTEVLDVGGIFERAAGNPFKDVNTTTSEVSVYSSAPSIKGNTLGTSRVMRIGIIGDTLANNGTPTFTVRVKYGATTVASFTTGALSASATRRGWRAQGEIAAAGATNAQVASFQWLHGTATGVSGVAAELETGGSNSIMLSTHNGIAEDSTADKTLDITIQPSASNASVGMRVHTVSVELL